MVAATITLTSCGPYQDLLKSTDGMEQYEAAFDYYKNKKYDRALTLLSLSMSQLYGTEYEDTVLFASGKILYVQNDFATAGETMNQYRNKFPRSSFTEEAEFIYAMCYYMMSNDVEKDQTDTRNAIIAFNEYINRHPESEFVPDIQKLSEDLTNKLYYKEYLNAALYYKLGNYLAAITSLKAVIKNNPETPFKEHTLYLICKSWYDYANNSIYTRQLDRYLNMIDAYYNYKTSFPESKQFSAELEKMRLISQEFVDTNGSTSQSLESSAAKVDAAKEKIEEAKDAIFYARNKEERKKIETKIKEQREIIKKERTNVRAEAKVLRENKKAEKQKIKQMEKEGREAAKEIAKEQDALKAKIKLELEQREQEIQKLNDEAAKILERNTGAVEDSTSEQ